MNKDRFICMCINSFASSLSFALVEWLNTVHTFRSKDWDKQKTKTFSTFFKESKLVTCSYNKIKYFKVSAASERF